MKLILLFLICALLFEFSTQIKNKGSYVPIIPKFSERGCRVQNGTLICLKPKSSNSTKIIKPTIIKNQNQTKCSVGNRLSCSKNASGETYCNCIKIFPIIKPTNRINKCPKGTFPKCGRIRRGCIISFGCFCEKVFKITPKFNITPISNQPKIKKIKSYEINNN